MAEGLGAPPPEQDLAMATCENGQFHTKGVLVSSKCTGSHTDVRTKGTSMRGHVNSWLADAYPSKILRVNEILRVRSCNWASDRQPLDPRIHATTILISQLTN